MDHFDNRSLRRNELLGIYHPLPGSFVYANHTPTVEAL